MTRDNNFNLIRLLAAIQVVLWHCNNHLLQLSGQTFVDIIKYFPGVPIFFTISGFLIFSSFENAKSLTDYFKNRFLRIFPALWVAFFISAFTIYLSGFTVDTFNENIKWILAQTTVFQNYVPNDLVEYGTHHPNHVLWTIPIELAFYVFVPFFFLFTKFCKINRTLFIIILFVISYTFNYSLLVLKDSNSLLFHSLNKTILPYLFYFLLGALAYLHWDRLKNLYINKAHYWLTLYIAYTLVFGVALDSYEQMYWLNGYGLLGAILLSQTILSFAYSVPSLSKKIIGNRDISYGLYLYHMIFINVAHHIGLINSQGFYLVLILTFLFALFSWELIEKPALRLKKKKFSDMLVILFSTRWWV